MEMRSLRLTARILTMTGDSLAIQLQTIIVFRLFVGNKFWTNTCYLQKKDRVEFHKVFDRNIIF